MLHLLVEWPSSSEEENVLPVEYSVEKIGAALEAAGLADVLVEAGAPLTAWPGYSHFVLQHAGDETVLRDAVRDAPALGGVVGVWADGEVPPSPPSSTPSGRDAFFASPPEIKRVSSLSEVVQGEEAEATRCKFLMEMFPDFDKASFPALILCRSVHPHQN